MNDTKVFDTDELYVSQRYWILDGTGKESKRSIYVGGKLMSQLQEVAEQKGLFYDDSPKNNLSDVSNVALQAFPEVRKMNDWEWIIDNDYMYKNKPLKEELIGTWFLCRTKDGHLFITKDKAEKFGGHFMLTGSDDEWKSGWLCLEAIGGSRFSDSSKYKDIKREDFLCLDFPEVTFENSPLEIEIMPSGKVYFY